MTSADYLTVEMGDQNGVALRVRGLGEVLLAAREARRRSEVAIRESLDICRNLGKPLARKAAAQFQFGKGLQSHIEETRPKRTGARGKQRPNSSRLATELKWLHARLPNCR